MNNIFKKTISVLLVAVMLPAAAPLAGFVGLELPEWLDVRKLLGVEAEAATYSGTCGDNLTWTLDTDTCVLEINGTGDMHDWPSNSSAPWGSYSAYVRTVKIDNGVTSVGDSAFVMCISLTDITIPDSVTSIGDGAFSACAILNNVIIPDNVTSIGDRAFEGCTYITNISIPNSVINIGARAFLNCTGLKNVTIGSGANAIKDSTFENCKNLENITIGSSVSTIGANAFRGCSSLTNITIPNNVLSIGDFAFIGCSKLERVTIGSGLKSIGFSMLSNNDKLVINVDPQNTAFSNDEYGVFYTKDRTELIMYPKGISGTSYVIPEGVKCIGYAAFSGCINLASITIPDSVLTIGDSAFSSCHGLTGITIPRCVTDIGSNAFSSCINLESFFVVPENTAFSSDEYGILFNKDKTKLIAYPMGNVRTSYAIPEGVTSIGRRAFYDCDNLTDITIPNGVLTIDERAFASCLKLLCVAIPDTVTTISDYAFEYCRNLTDLTIGKNVVDIGANVFDTCTNLKNVVFRNGTSVISYGLFWNCSKIESVTIPDSVTSVCGYAFYGCTGITDVYYTGTEAQWDNIVISDGNEYLVNATIHYNYDSGSSDNSGDAVPDVEIDETVLKTPTQKTIHYGDAIVLHVDESKIPQGSSVKWTASNSNFDYSVSADGATCTITPSKSGDTTFTATVYDAEGNEISKDEQVMTSKAGFFDKIIAFFKKLFGLLKTYQQSL